MSVAIVAPAGVRSIAMMRACLVLGRAADRNDAGAVRLRDAALAIFRAVERVVAFGLVLGLVMGSSEVHAIRRTTSAPPRQITRQGRTLKRALAAPSRHSNAPLKPASQSILSNLVTLTPKEAQFSHTWSSWMGLTKAPPVRTGTPCKCLPTERGQL